MSELSNKTLFAAFLQFLHVGSNWDNIIWSETYFLKKRIIENSSYIYQKLFLKIFEECTASV